MKQTLILFFLLISLHKVSAQTSASIVSWKYSVVEKDGVKQIKMDATIKEGWHLYSQFLVGDGPIPTTFNFVESKNYTMVGKVKESEAKTAYDPNFDMEISFFEGKTTFYQEVKNQTSVPQKISGSVEFMVCDDHMCYPPETVQITVDLP